MNKDKDKDILAEALAQLKQRGLSEQPPKAVVEETIQRLAESQRIAGDAGASASSYSRPRRTFLGRTAVRLSLGAAALIALGYVLGRFSSPEPVNLDKLKKELTPAVAASIEPVIREKLVDEMRQRYQVALAASCVKLEEKLTQQYRDDLNRYAIQTLVASNAVTNQRLAELIENIDTAQAQDRSQIARAIHQVELNRVQDKTQLAAGLQTLASLTQDELSKTRKQFVQLLANYELEDVGLEPQPLPNREERNKQ